MPNLTLRDVPEELHLWLKDSARAHRRSVNREAILLLELIRTGQDTVRRKASYEDLLAISRQAAALPVLDSRDEADILGLDEAGVPRN
ncbi:MAG: hypothetical protein JSR42_10100 [Proteobacteria bacterium]|nr:hypothetical protein [Pseudomonadota bacterium]MBS0554306.1 hypothetical protein [Pseudomonadota bacterium]